MSSLSDEQRRRLEENKRKALAIRAAKQQQQQSQQQRQQLLQSQHLLKNQPQYQRPHHQQPPQPTRYNQQQNQVQSQQQHQQQQNQSHVQQWSGNKTPTEGQRVHSLQPLRNQSLTSTAQSDSFTRSSSQINTASSFSTNYSQSYQSKSKPTSTFPANSNQPVSNTFYKNKTSVSASAPGINKPASGPHVNKVQQRGRTVENAAGKNQTAGLPSGFMSIHGTCVLCSRTRFEVQVNYSSALIELFKTMETKQYNSQTKRWSFDLLEYTKLRKAVDELGGNIKLEPLPHCVLHTFRNRIRGQEESDASRVPEADLSHVDKKLVTALLPFQHKGVDFALWKKGRMLFADDMGLGKTLQAICVACFYRAEWPLLIVVPSSVRFAWREQLLKWVPTIDPQEISVIVTTKDHVTGGDIVIVSYDLLVRSKTLQNRLFNVVIVDECHLLKNSKTARTKAVLPILKRASRVILLSGTPALSRPSELFTQISAVDKKTFPQFHEYGLRYCDGKQHQWGWDFSGSSNMEELQIVLQENIMIRRLKKEVLSQLPQKRREMIVLNPSSVKGTKFMKAKHKEVGTLKGMEQRGALLEYFHETGSCKGPAVKEYVLDLLEADHKFLFFGHHQEMLDCIEDAVRNKYGYIRIDGRTSGDQRNQLVHQFQTTDETKVAILSIMAANAGINLTAASLVIFGELFWNPGILVQAEDRVHRIGQEDSVSVRYLVATGTADDYIWPLVQQKLSVLGKAGLTKDDFSSADTHHMRDPKQPDMMSFFEQSFFDEVWEDDCAARPEFVDNPSPKKKTPSKSRSMNAGTPTKYKQRTLFKYLSPSKEAARGNGNESAKPAVTQTVQKGLLLRFMSPIKETDRQKKEVDRKLTEGEDEDLGVNALSTVDAEFGELDDWEEDIPESMLRDIDFSEEPLVKRCKLDL